MIRINLLSVREVAREEGRRQEKRLVALGATLMLAALIAVDVGSRMRLTPVRAEHRNLQTELNALDVKTKELADLERLRGELGEKLKTIELLEQRRVGPVQILADLSDAAPEQVWLLDFTEINGAATITGHALDNQTIATFMRNLAGSPYFATVDLVESTQEDQEGVQLKRFVLNARLSYAGKPIEQSPEVKYPDPPKGTSPAQQRRNRKGNRA